ncbi:sugar transferase [Desulfopila aestuarii]|uniref:Undecaprenyl-phosphate galactose phosphotransferase, WbaP/exopolysaccharide biosynthesis polyprenyl glycosylphosphotransferase n=1 Tax=Desulfopila aestuarii DSM 18488 TaxID=1121416 RepID=A0A1M7YFN8_9BACT|nr:sugar transferase [Desulfopila aestuarii]SHO51452.1 Undecaprenyl-phosphate galactose phosphotransferase, WbaP/exopolysaccharide biosynthesis polyprenyl glycosylphosphotransferase [Desulfopila aestuarii DSM 18488]
MFDERSRDTQRLLSLLDIFFTVLSFASALWIFEQIHSDEQVDFFSHIAILPLILALLIFSLSYFNVYRNPRSASSVFYVAAIIQAMATVLGILFFLLFILNIHYVSRIIIIGFAATDVTLMIGSRLIVRRNFLRAINQGKGLLNVLIIGSGERALLLTRALKKKADWGINIIGYLDTDPELTGRKVSGGTILGTVDDIHSILKSHVLDEVIVAIPRSMITDVDSIALACEEEGVKFRFMADIFNIVAARVSLTNLADIPILTLEPVALNETKLMIKRFIDLLLSAVALPILLPIMALIAIAIKIDDGGPIFFIQHRVGLKKRLFPMFKFRTMHVNAEEMLKDIEHLNEMEGPNFKIANDPRITRIGRFLRHTSLDELPQLINVIRGEMSLVGPRPMSIRDVELFDKGIQRKRFSVKPGITCIWQVSGRNNLPFHKWLELDLQYIDNWSLSLDIWLLLKTIPVVLLRKGAM